MTIAEAKQIIEDDDDFGSDGTLKDNYEDKFGEMDQVSNDLNNDDDQGDD